MQSTLRLQLLLSVGLLWLASCEIRLPGTAGKSAPDRPPNILLIVADDMGFSDLGAFGGDARTPNLDRLANEGVRLTNFHAAPSCSPSRAQMLSGADNHLVGLGNMGELLFMYPWQRGKPGYEGYLTHRAVTIGTVLKEHGYRTYMTGKWHMGHAPDLIPLARGFDRSFALMNGTSSHYAADNGREGHPTIVVEDGQRVDWPEGKYSSDHYADKLLEYLKADKSDKRPFFAYLAFTVPHHPLHAPQSHIDKYRGVFDDGYEALARKRLARMRKLGIIPDRDIRVSPHPSARQWDTLPDREKRFQSRLMQVHAAMIDNMDHNVGRVLKHLEATGQLDHTIVVFLSDNGASDQEMSTFPLWKARYQASNNTPENIGRADSWTGIGVGWAHAITTPNRLSKHYTSEGGIHVPALLWRSGLNTGGRISTAFTHVRDVAPTLADYAGLSLSPGYFKKRDAVPWEGVSLKALLEGTGNAVHGKDRVFAWEHRERLGLIKGDWKLLKLPEPFGSGEWELIHLANDPGETADVSAAYPDKFSELLQDWQAYVKEYNVVLRDAP